MKSWTNKMCRENIQISNKTFIDLYAILKYIELQEVPDSVWVGIGFVSVFYRITQIDSDFKDDCTKF